MYINFSNTLIFVVFVYVCYFLTVAIIASLWWHDILYGLSVFFQNLQLLLYETHWPLPSSMVGPREYWMIFRGPGFRTRFLAHPLAPLSRQQVASISVLMCAAGKLKGTVSREFCFRFFSWITFPQVPKNDIKVISNFFENSRRYSQVKVHHRYQRHRWHICLRCQWQRWQILPPVQLVMLIMVANNGNNIRLQIS